MISLTPARWAAWSPGIESVDDWHAWARAPRELAREGRPDVSFLPALQRRRCDQLSRMMLRAARDCCGERALGALPCVFASRHGSFATTLALVADLARDQPLSPAQFSHSVHNTQAGLFSIWAGNRSASMSLAARADTFAHGFLEATALLHREPVAAVLLIVGDEAAPESVLHLADEPPGAYALALRLERGSQLQLSLAEAAACNAPGRWPDALEFLRWWLEGGDALRIAHPPRAWTWRRATPRPDG